MATATSTPSSEQAYLFDVWGFIKLKGVLDTGELKQLNAILDADPSLLDAPTWGGSADGTHPRASFLTAGAPFRALIDHPRVLPYLTAWVDPALRLDHCYGIFSRPKEKQLPMHHGGTPHHYFAHYATDGMRIRSGLTVVSWALNDQPIGMGTFTCVPGSHKAALDCPPEVRRYERDLACVLEVPVRAGDVLVFTEALTHGARSWRAPYRRRSILLKYAPGCLAWSNERWPPALLDVATPAQRRLLRGPWMHDISRSDHGFRSSALDEHDFPILHPGDG